MAYQEDPNRQRLIVLQNSGSQAAAIYASMIGAGLVGQFNFEEYQDIRDLIFEATMAGQPVVEKLKNPVAYVNVADTAAGFPVAVPGTKDVLWQDLISDPGGWFDNRPEKVGAEAGTALSKRPDFKKKGSKAGVNAPALWLDSRDTPSWAIGALS